MARVVLETGRIAHRVDVQEEAFGQLRLASYVTKKTRQGEGAGWLVAVDSGKKPNANGITAVGSSKTEAWQRIFFGTHDETPERLGVYPGNFLQRRQKVFQRPPPIFD